MRRGMAQMLPFWMGEPSKDLEKRKADEMLMRKNSNMLTFCVSFTESNIQAPMNIHFMHLCHVSHEYAMPALTPEYDVKCRCT